MTTEISGFISLDNDYGSSILRDFSRTYFPGALSIITPMDDNESSMVSSIDITVKDMLFDDVIGEMELFIDHLYSENLIRWVRVSVVNGENSEDISIDSSELYV